MKFFTITHKISSIFFLFIHLSNTLIADDEKDFFDNDSKVNYTHSLDRDLGTKDELWKWKFRKKISKTFDFNNGSFESDFTGWDTRGNISIQTSAFGVVPTQGSKQALLRTENVIADSEMEIFLGMPAGSLDGLGNGNATAGAAIRQVFFANAGDIIQFNWNFLTTESTPSSFNDFAFFTLHLDGATGSPVELADTGSPFTFSSSPFYRETNYKVRQITIPAPGFYVLGLGTLNSQDTFAASALLVDNVLRCPFNNQAPAGSGTIQLNVFEDSANSNINLNFGFNDPDNLDSDLTYTIESNNNPSLFASVAITDNILILDYAQDANGSANIVVRATDKCGKFGFTTYNVNVIAVNDIPTYTIGSNITVNEDAGLQTIPNWATNISPGPPNESSQTLTFVTNTTTNPTLSFTSLPSVSPTGTLTFETTPNSFGTAVVTIFLRDSQNGQTTSQIFNIIVNSVNDAPTFSKGANINVLEDTGAQTIANWATNINKGASNENTQNLVFTTNITNSGGLAFTQTPTLDANSGTLTFTPAPNSFGTATLNVFLQDDGGTANGGISLSIVETFTITVEAVNDAPTLANLNNLIIVPDAGQQTVNLTGISAGPNENQTLTITATSSDLTLILQPTVNYTSPLATGNIQFTPVSGQAGRSSIITVTVTDDGGTANSGINLFVRTFEVTVEPINVAPTLNEIQNIQIVKNAPEQTITLSGISAGGGQNQQMTIIASSSNTDLIPNPIVNYTSPNSIGTLKFKPNVDKIGACIITLTITDNGGTANGGVNTFQRQFTIDVLADFPNRPPTLDDIPDIFIDTPTSEVEVNLSGISAGIGDNNVLTIRAISNNTELVNNIEIDYTSPNPTGILKLTLKENVSGLSIISVTIQDDGGTLAGSFDAVTKTFVLNVDLVSGIELLPPNSIILFPNPHKGAFKIDSKGIFQQESELTIYNEWGQTITTFSFPSDNTLIEMPYLAKGMYIVELKDRKKRILKRMLKIE